MYIIQFGLYFFSFLLTESMINERAAEIFDIGIVNYIYAAGLIGTALGYVLFSGFYRERRREFVMPVCVAAIAFAWCMVYTEKPVCWLLSAELALISHGYLGAYVHYLVSFYRTRPHFAGRLGTGMALAVVLQYVVQLFNGNDYIFIIFVTVSGLLLGGLYKRAVRASAKLEECAEDNQVKQVSRRLILCVAMVAILSVILGMEDSIMVYKNAAGELQLFSAVRLLYAIGLLLAGMIADIRKRVYLPLATACSVMLSTIVIACLAEGALAYQVSMGFMYFYSGFYVMYLTLMFVDLAEGRRQRALIAGMGRIVRSTATAVTVILISLLGNTLNYTLCTGINCILTIVVLVLFALDEMAKKAEDSKFGEAGAGEKTTSGQEHYEGFCEHYHFTEKEKESFRLLISTEDTVQKIADDLGISRRVLQRHISSMYDKTKTQTRVGLLMAYTNYRESQ